MNDPFAVVIPVPGTGEVPVCAQESSKPEVRESFPNPPAKPIKRQKLTVHLQSDLIERVKNAAYWSPGLTIASIAERGIIDAIAGIEKENGGPYPSRKEELRGGRPMK